jgi:hypothetical protein
MFVDPREVAYIQFKLEKLRTATREAASRNEAYVDLTAALPLGCGVYVKWRIEPLTERAILSLHAAAGTVLLEADALNIARKFFMVTPTLQWGANPGVRYEFA